MTIIRRVRESALALRKALIPEPPRKKPLDAGGYTGEGPLLRSLLRDAERNRKRHDDVVQRQQDVESPD